MNISNYYVSGCTGKGEEIETCGDDVAQFWTLYHRNDEGLSEAIIDCMSREDAETAMRVYEQRDALAAENDILKRGIGFFSYGTDSGFEEHDSAEKAIAAADSDIDYYRGDACDGWSEETDRTVWGVIMQRATVTGLRAVTEDDSCDPSIKEWCDYTLLPSIETPDTDACLNAVRAEGVEMFAKHCDDNVTFVEPEDEALYTLMEEAARAFAAHLRAGKDGE